MEQKRKLQVFGLWDKRWRISSYGTDAWECSDRTTAVYSAPGEANPPQCDSTWGLPAESMRQNDVTKKLGDYQKSHKQEKPKHDYRPLRTLNPKLTLRHEL